MNPATKAQAQPIRPDHPKFFGSEPTSHLQLLKPAGEPANADQAQQLWLPFPGAPRPIVVSPEILDYLRHVRRRPRDGFRWISRAVADVIGLQRRGFTRAEAMAVIEDKMELSPCQRKRLRVRVGRVQHAVER